MLVRLLIAAALTGGCVSYHAVRASSLPGTDPSPATVTIEKPRADVTRIVQDIFASRGFPVVNKVEQQGGAFYIFKGSRQTVTSVSGETTVLPGNLGGHGSVSSQTYNVGSWFVAHVSEKGTGTEVFLLGKPTINGQEVCSDADVLIKAADYWCQDTKLKEGAPEGPFMTGREEAETVKGVLIELESKTK